MNEQDKQQILNGAYGVTRDGRKAKYIGKYPSNDYPYYFIFLDDDNMINSTTTLTKEFTEYIDSSNKLDIVGLWKEPLKPFNLEKALQGEPVMLRNGEKALIQYNILDFIKDGIEFTGVLPLKGFRYSEVKGITKIYTEEWAITGESYPDTKSDNDIVGMWEEPTEPKLKELSDVVLPPKALRKPKEGMWYLNLNREEVFASSYTEKDFDVVDRKTFNLGMYFDSKEKAEAMLYFLKNNKE